MVWLHHLSPTLKFPAPALPLGNNFWRDCSYSSWLSWVTGILETNPTFQEVVMPSGLLWRLRQMIQVWGGTEPLTACNPQPSYWEEAASACRPTPVGTQLPEFGGRLLLQPRHSRFHFDQILGEHFCTHLSGPSSQSSGAVCVYFPKLRADIFFHWNTELGATLTPSTFCWGLCPWHIYLHGTWLYCCLEEASCKTWPSRSCVSEGEYDRSISLPGNEVKLLFIRHLRCAAQAWYFNF